MKLIQSSGGVFEVEVDGRRVFSKKTLGRHAEPGEVLRLMRQVAPPSSCMPRGLDAAIRDAALTTAIPRGNALARPKRMLLDSNTIATSHHYHLAPHRLAA